MSRVPHPPSRSPQKAPLRTPTTPTPTSRSRTGSPLTVGPTTPRARTKSMPKSPSRTPISKASLQSEPLPQKTPLSIREAIALKRAEAKKAAPKSAGEGPNSFENLEDASPVLSSPKGEDEILDLGRWSIKETIERARNTGSLNLSTRSLPCLPSALFDIHLGITPDPLKSVPKEPPIASADAASSRRGVQREKPSWYEAQDLHILKAWNNDIVEIQHEISLFGSLKAVDLHQNKISSLPETFADLTALTSLDLSHNHLKSFPSNFFALPNLSILNISHNELTALPFREPFSNPNRQNNLAVESFFSPIIVRASSPLPCLVTLDASHNNISANGIDHDANAVPASLSKLDLSFNPLNTEGTKCRSLLQALSKLSKLRELSLVGADIGDDEFAPDLFSPSSTPSPFPSLKSLNLGETRVTAEAAKEALRSMQQEISFYVTTEDPPAGVVGVIVGKKVIKETWEIEAEQRAKSRPAKFLDADPVWTGQKSEENAKDVVKESWEIDAEQGVLTEGGRRRARAAAAAAVSTSRNQDSGIQAAPSERVVVKEPWEIEAELGLLTEGGRRRARIAAAAKNTTDNGKRSSPPDDQSTSNVTLLNSQYYTPSTQTLKLPSSAPPSKAHSRAFSFAAPTSSWSSTPTSTSDITLPTPTLPLGLIVAQPFAQTLKILDLANRRMDRSVSLPSLTDGGTDGPWLPNLEELNLDGCGLGDTVPVSRVVKSGSGASTPPRSNELLLPLLTRLFPGMRTLDLSYNVLTSASIQTDVLSSLILSAPGVPSDPAQPPRKGLRQLRLRGNRLGELDGLQGMAELFKRNREVPAWKLDELDLRDNEIGKLPPELGLMPLDVFLVDGNLFRVPQRRVWEREGTKGLLSWLRGRIE